MTRLFLRTRGRTDGGHLSVTLYLKKIPMRPSDFCGACTSHSPVPHHTPRPASAIDVSPSIPVALSKERCCQPRVWVAHLSPLEDRRATLGGVVSRLGDTPHIVVGRRESSRLLLEVCTLRKDGIEGSPILGEFLQLQPHEGDASLAYSLMRSVVVSCASFSLLLAS